MPRKLHWICQQPTPYNDFLFRSLAADPEIDLTVHFIQPILSSHPWKSKMAQGFHSRMFRRRFGLDWQMLHLVGHETKSFFVVAGWNEPTLITTINLLILRKQPFAIWTDTPNLKAKRHPVKTVLRQKWLQYVFHQARYVMGTGQPAVEALQEMGCESQKLMNFPFFIDLETFAPSKEAKKPKTETENIVLLSSGRLVNNHKGYDLAIRALAKVKLQGSPAPFQYRIAGVGPDELTLKALVKENGLEQVIEFVGWLEPQELPDFYRSGDIFLHPSHFDPFPNSILEAMASGLSVLGSDKAGSALDRIHHLKNGLIHRANDVMDLAEKILFALAHRDILPEWGNAARRTAEQWSVQRGVKLIKHILNQT